MELDEKRRMELIKSWVHKVFRPIATKFTGLTKSAIYESFSKRQCLYVAYMLVKSEK